MADWLKMFVHETPDFHPLHFAQAIARHIDGETVEAGTIHASAWANAASVAIRWAA